MTSRPTRNDSNSIGIGVTERAIRTIYLTGPGDVIGTYRHWREGRDDPSQISVTYSGQFYDVCRELGIRATVISSHPRREQIREDGFIIEHRPIPLKTWRGVFYHFGQYCFHLGIAMRAIRDRCDLIFLATESHLAPYWIAVAARIGVVPVNHCKLWAQHRRTGLAGLNCYFDKLFFRSGCFRILTASSEISKQISELTGGIHSPILEFLPTYRRDTFADIPKADHSLRPFRVLFAGRIEANKGVFDLLEIARNLSQNRNDIVIDIAGDGSAMPELRRKTTAQELDHIVKIHGYCTQPRMKQLLCGSHVVIVPTRGDFAEGFNQVVAEAVLARRPFITSNVCPALEYVREGGIEVTAENVEGYAAAIVQLADNVEVYQAKCDACDLLREQFFDESQSWAAALRSVFSESTHHN